MIHNYVIEGDGIKLMPLVEEDIEKLRSWRNDEKSTKYLRPIKHISKEQQESWFKSYEIDDNILIFSIIDVSINRMVGSVALYNFDKKTMTCEAGKIQIGDNAAHGKGLASKAMALVSLLAFKVLEYERVLAIVNENNIAAYKSYQRIGFNIVRKIKSHSSIGGFDYLIELTELRLCSSYSDFLGSSSICLTK